MRYLLVQVQLSVPNYAIIAQWQSISLPTKRSRVRIPLFAPILNIQVQFSMVERLLWEQGVAGSSPVTQTINIPCVPDNGLLNRSIKSQEEVRGSIPPRGTIYKNIDRQANWQSHLILAQAFVRTLRVRPLPGQPK